MSRKRTSKQGRTPVRKPSRKTRAQASAPTTSRADEPQLAVSAASALPSVSAEMFIALPEDEPPAVASEDMEKFLGEIFVEGARAGNDVALDMETLQPVRSTQAARPVIAMGPVISTGQVRELLAEFDEDAPTLPDPRYAWVDTRELPAVAEASGAALYTPPVTAR